MNLIMNIKKFQRFLMENSLFFQEMPIIFLQLIKIIKLTDYNNVILKFVFWNLKIKGGWTFPNSSASVIMRSVAWAIVTTKFTSICNRYTTQVSANSKNNEPFGFFDSFRIGLRIAKSCDIDLIFSIYFIRRSVIKFILLFI